MVFGLRFPFRRPRPSTIRPLRVEAAEACAAIHRTGFAHPWSAGEFASLLASPTTLASAALDPATGRLRGFALSRLAADEAEILTVAVARIALASDPATNPPRPLYVKPPDAKPAAGEAIARRDN